MAQLKLAAADAKTWGSDLWGARVIEGEILRCAQNDDETATATATAWNINTEDTEKGGGHGGAE